MRLGKLIEWLSEKDRSSVIKHGFGSPMSYRGYYDDLAFDPVKETTIGDMLENAKSALGQTFEGYKGGEFTMNECSQCWIAEYGTSQGDLIGPTIIALWELQLNGEQK